MQQKAINYLTIFYRKFHVKIKKTLLVTFLFHLVREITWKFWRIFKIKTGKKLFTLLAIA